MKTTEETVLLYNARNASQPRSAVLHFICRWRQGRGFLFKISSIYIYILCIHTYRQSLDNLGKRERERERERALSLSLSLSLLGNFPLPCHVAPYWCKYTHTYIYMYTYLYVYKYINVYVYIWIYTYSYIYAYTCMYMNIMYTYLSAIPHCPPRHVASSPPRCALLIHIDTYIYIYIYTNLYIYKYIHIYVQI